MEQATPNREDLIRLAAFIDGEGCIEVKPISRKTVKGRIHTFTLALAVYNTDPRMPRWCADVFGGHVYCEKSPAVRCMPLYSWKVTCRDAERILRLCLDFFVIKREQAEIGIQFRETLSGHYRRVGVPPSVTAERIELSRKMTLLKKPYLVATNVTRAVERTA